MTIHICFFYIWCSHELRTPMAAVIGLLDILICDDCLTNEQYATITQIRRCSTALLRLLNNILDISKVESGKMVLEETEFDLGRELEGLVDMFSVQCINQNVETILDLSDDMPKVIQGDSARVVQIFANLISNSIKFTTSGHIILRGWCENPNKNANFALNQKALSPAPETRVKQQGSHKKRPSNVVKMELRSRGHLLMVNKPLYKSKMIQIMEAIIKENNLEMQRKINSLRSSILDGEMHEFVEIDPIHSDAESTSDKSEAGNYKSTSAYQIEEKHEDDLIPSASQCGATNICFVQLTEVCSGNKLSTNETVPGIPSIQQNSNWRDHLTGPGVNEGARLHSNNAMTGQKPLEGLRLLLAEDTPILQRVATIMLEKMGATVVVVGDGMQAVEALKFEESTEECGVTPPQHGNTEVKACDLPPYDLILMDCQMPKMDGYEATKAIRRSELGTESHIPIVALTAHAMSSDEAKCLEVGMDAYLTKPIDCKLMVSTILSLTRKQI